MNTSKCFINDLKELMLLHSMKSLDFTGNIDRNFKLKIDNIRAIGFDNVELYPVNNISKF